MSLNENQNVECIGNSIHEFVNEFLNSYLNMPNNMVVKEMDPDRFDFVKNIGIPKEGRAVKEVVHELVKDVYPYGHNSGHPRYFGFVSYSYHEFVGKRFHQLVRGNIQA